MRGKLAAFILCWLLGLGVPGRLSAQTNDLLAFTDGSALHGSLVDINSSGLQWNSPVTLNPVQFKPPGLDSVQFSHGSLFSLTADCRVRFVNGDNLLASINSLDDQNMAFSTWFGKSVTVSRQSVQSITFLPTNYTITYEGPTDAEGWVVGSHNPECWSYRDGTFISGFPGTLGRDFRLTNSMTLDFTVHWTETFDLLVNLYANSADRMNFENSYILDIRRDQVTMRHTGVGTVAPTRTFGTAPMPIPTNATSAHLTIQCNQSDGTVSLLVDDNLVKRWKDDHGFSARGGCVVFEQEVLNGSPLKISNIRVADWSGRFEPETADVVSNIDSIRFVNHDHALGKIASIHDGKVAFQMASNILEVPLHRVTQINFATNQPAPGIIGPWTVRAHFLSGGSVSFDLEQWSKNQVVGRSDVFGKLAFNPERIQKLEFNLNRPPTPPRAAAEREYDGLDE